MKLRVERFKSFTPHRPGSRAVPLLTGQQGPAAHFQVLTQTILTETTLPANTSVSVATIAYQPSSNNATIKLTATFSVSQLSNNPIFVDFVKDGSVFMFTNSGSVASSTTIKKTYTVVGFFTGVTAAAHTFSFSVFSSFGASSLLNIFFMLEDVS